MLRKLLLGAGAAAALYALLAAVLLLRFDPEALRPRLEQALADRYQRTLRIAGEPRLAVFPRLVIELPPSTLSEHASPRAFATFERARIGVALLPLLSGRLQAGRIEVAALRATVERRDDGSTSIDDLLGRGPGRAPAEPAGREAAPPLGIGRIDLVDARLTLVKDGVTEFEVSQLDLGIGALAPKTAAPIKLAAAFAAPRAGVRGSLALAGELERDAAAGSVGVRALQARMTAFAAGNRLDLQTNIARLAVGDAVTAEGIGFDLWPTGSRSSHVRIEAAAIEGPPQRLTVRGLRANADLQQGARRISARLGGEALASIDAGTLRLEGLSGEGTLVDPSLPARTVDWALAGTAALDLAGQTARVQFDARADQTALKGQLDMAGYAPLKVRLDIEADRLDVDRYLPPASQTAASAAPDNARDGRRIDLAPIRRLQLAGRVRIGELRALGIQASDVEVGAHTEGGRLELYPLRARAYGGTVLATAFAAEDNRMGLNASLTDVQLGPLLRDALKANGLAGTGNVQANLVTAGVDIDAARRALEGTVALQLRDAAIRGLDLGARLREAPDRLRGLRGGPRPTDPSQQTAFSTLSATVAIRDGVLRNDDLEARSSVLQLSGSGSIDLAAGRIDYTARVRPARAGGDLDALRGLAIPVRFAGTLAQPTYEVDWAAAAQEALKAGAAARLMKRLAPRASGAAAPSHESAGTPAPGLSKP